MSDVLCLTKLDDTKRKNWRPVNVPCEYFTHPNELNYNLRKELDAWGNNYRHARYYIKRIYWDAEGNRTDTLIIISGEHGCWSIGGSAYLGANAGVYFDKFEDLREFLIPTKPIQLDLFD